MRRDLKPGEIIARIRQREAIRGYRETMAQVAVTHEQAVRALFARIGGDPFDTIQPLDANPGEPRH